MKCNLSQNYKPKKKMSREDSKKLQSVVETAMFNAFKNAGKTEKGGVDE